MQRIDLLRINCLQNMAGQLLRRAFSDQRISERTNECQRTPARKRHRSPSQLLNFPQMPAIKYRRETTSTETKRKMIYHSLLVKLADSLEIAFIRLTLQYFFSSIAPPQTKDGKMGSLGFCAGSSLT